MKYLTNIIFIIFVLTFIIFGYFWYQRIASGPQQNVVPEQFGLSQKFLDTINKLRSIKIDESFLGSDDFRSLKDLTPEVGVPTDIGRTNPFLPLQ